MKFILIVEDNDLILYAVTKGLRTLLKGWDIVTASNGKEAIAVLDSVDVSVILTDLEMPVMDGFQLISHARKKNPHIPIMVMTSYCSEEVQEKLSSFGVIQCIEKPFSFKTVADRILGESPAKSESIVKKVIAEGLVIGNGQ